MLVFRGVACVFFGGGDFGLRILPWKITIQPPAVIKGRKIVAETSCVCFLLVIFFTDSTMGIHHH